MRRKEWSREGNGSREGLRKKWQSKEEEGGKGGKAGRCGSEEEVVEEEKGIRAGSGSREGLRKELE